MAKYFNITLATATIVDIDTSNTGQQYAGNVSSISLCNNSSSNAVTSIKLVDRGTTDTYYMVQDVVIPVGVTLLLDHDISFDVNKYRLDLDNSGTSPNITIIIK